MNIVMLVGRLVADPELKETDGNKKMVNVTVAVTRSYRNPDGIIESDFVDCVLWDGLAKNLTDYCKKGDTVGVRGRIQVDHYEREDGSKAKSVKVVAERITFLSSKSVQEDKNNNQKKEKNKN